MEQNSAPLFSQAIFGIATTFAYETKWKFSNYLKNQKPGRLKDKRDVNSMNSQNYVWIHGDSVRKYLVRVRT